MPSIRHAGWLGLALIVTGCQSRLNVDRACHLDTGESRSFEIDPPRREQKVTLTVDADALVSLQVYLKKDADSVEKDLSLKQKSDKTLAVWSGQGKQTIEAIVPSHEMAIVRVEAGSKPANVTMHIKGD